jgi:putative membrane protein insertion efficiency factor
MQEAPVPSRSQNTTRRAIGRIPRWIAIAAVRTYQLLLSPAVRQFLGPGARCRFHPTCSNYALECFRRHPFHRALYLSIRRLLKCHPFHVGGLDPVPPAEDPRATADGDVPGERDDPRAITPETHR